MCPRDTCCRRIQLCPRSGKDVGASSALVEVHAEQWTQVSSASFCELAQQGKASSSPRLVTV